MILSFNIAVLFYGFNFSTFPTHSTINKDIVPKHLYFCLHATDPNNVANQPDHETEVWW